MKMDHFLNIHKLCVTFPGEKGPVKASDGVDLKMQKGDTLCLVGESGSGKTVVGLSILRLLPENARVDGDIWFNGDNLLHFEKKKIRNIRGRGIAMIFEQPASCLNPVFTIGNQIAEAVRMNERCSKKTAQKRVVSLLEKVGMASPEKRYHHYPHELSGGMMQRVMIAMALACRPMLLIADEPTTSLDVTIRAQMVNLLKDVTAELQASLLLITHDLHVAARLCRKVAVMYAGNIVEEGAVDRVFRTPKHPYTQALLDAALANNNSAVDRDVNGISRPPSGCRFYPRCLTAVDICRKEMPAMVDGVRCHRWR